MKTVIEIVPIARTITMTGEILIGDPTLHTTHLTHLTMTGIEITIGIEIKHHLNIKNTIHSVGTEPPVTIDNLGQIEIIGIIKAIGENQAKTGDNHDLSFSEMS